MIVARHAALSCSTAGAARHTEMYPHAPRIADPRCNQVLIFRFLKIEANHLTFRTLHNVVYSKTVRKQSSHASCETALPENNSMQKEPS